MLNRLFPNSASDGGPVTVEPLRVSDLGKVRQSWLSGLSREALARHVERYPHFCWWVPRSGDYIAGEPWRHRSDIGCIVELNARNNARDALTARLAEVFVAQGYKAVVLGFDGWQEYANYYASIGFSALERIVYYEKPNMQLSYQPNAELANGAVTIERLKPEEMGIYLARYQGQPLGYFSYTVFDKWGHLDRIAVDPRAQGLGLGAAQLARAISEMRPYGVQRVTLSTQATNARSRKLYEGFGFRLTGESYHIYGKMLDGEELKVSS